MWKLYAVLVAAVFTLTSSQFSEESSSVSYRLIVLRVNAVTLRRNPTNLNLTNETFVFDRALFALEIIES